MKPFYLPTGRWRAVARTCTILIFSVFFFASPTNAQTLLSAQTIGASIANGGEVRVITNAVDATGNIYLGGWFTSTFDADPGTGVTNLVSRGGEDAFIAKYTAAGALVWAGSFGGGATDICRDMLIDPNGDLIVSGYFSGIVDFDPGPGITKLTSNGNYDIFFAKFSAVGNLVFAKSMGGTTNDSGLGLSLDAAGNIFLTGTITSATVDFDPGPGVVMLTKKGTVDAFLARYDNDGNYVWAFNLGGTTGSQVSPQRVTVTAAGGGAVYFSGYLSGSAVDFDPGAATNNLTPVGGTSADIFLAKFDLSGNYSWGFVVGGLGGDAVNGMDVDASGNVYLAGYFNGTVDFDPSGATVNKTSAGAGDIFLAKYSSAGAYLWVNTLGGTANESAQTVKVDATGSPVMGGVFFNTMDFDPGNGTVNLTANGTSQDIFIAKYSAAGAYTWARRIGGTSNEVVNNIITDASDNLYAVGSFVGTVDFDPGAGTVNLTSPGTQNMGYSLRLSSAGIYGSAFAQQGYLSGVSSSQTVGATWIDAANNYYITGGFSQTVDFDPGAGVSTLTAVSYQDCYIAKYNAAGQLVFAKSLGNTDGGLQGMGICADASGNVYVTGRFQNTLDADPGAGVVDLVSAGSYDIYLVKLSSSGAYLASARIGAAGSEVINGITIDNSGAIYLTGSFSATVDFDPGAGIVSLTSKGGTDAFVAKYNSSLQYVFAAGLGGTGNDLGTSVAVDATGNVYTTGMFGGTADFDPGAAVVNLVSAGGNDFFLSKLSASGNYINAIGIGGAGNEMGNALTIDNMGNVYVAGQFSVTVDFDPGAGTTALTSAGGTDAFVAKYDASLNFVNAASVGGTSTDIANRIKLDSRGYVYFAGDFSSPSLSIPVNGTPQSFGNEGGTDVYLGVLDQAFNFISARTVTGSQGELTGGIAVDNSDNVYLTGAFTITANIDNLTGNDVYPFNSINNRDIFIAKFAELTMLPIKLESFTATQQQSQVVTKWTVSSQVNNDYFTLERSADGSQFSALGRITGCVDCQTRMDYQFIDKQPLTGWSYYRLKQTDLDGRSTYSQIVRVNYSGTTGQLSLYPTVTDNAYTLSYNNKSNSNQQATIRLFNTAGTMVHQVNVVLKPGMNNVPMTLAKLSAGTYYTSLIIARDNTVQTATVIKQR